MQLVVGICDDCAAHAALLEKYIRGCQGPDELRILTSADPRRFWEMVQQEALKLVFLDIDMDGMDGIELGEKIREMNCDTVIIYVTAHEKYALEAFRVRAFHYLLKPLTQGKVQAVLVEAVTFIRKKPSPAPVFTIQRRGELVSLPVAYIACFEKVGHKIRMHTESRSEEYYGNFTQLITQIEKEGFIQCHQGYIVNVTKIRAFRDKTLYLESGMQVPVSRTYAEKVREALAKHLFAGRSKP